MIILGIPDCTIVGDVLFDVIIKGSRDCIRFSKGGTSYCNIARITMGGAGNIAIGLVSLGGEAGFIGKAGNDLLGKLYLRNLKKKGVISNVFFEENLATGLTIVLIEGGERSFLVLRGANDSLSIDEVEKTVDLIKRSRYLYFSGYSLLKNPQRNGVLRAVVLAKKFGSKIVFDPGAHNLIKSNQRLFTELMRMCDVLSINLKEAVTLVGSNKMCDLVDELRCKVPLVALRCGKRGSILVGRKNIVKTPACKVQAIDTTGAGDAFTSALIFGLTRGLSLEEIGQLANWFSAQVVRHIGARQFPSKSKIDNFLRKLNV